MFSATYWKDVSRKLPPVLQHRTAAATLTLLHSDISALRCVLRTSEYLHSARQCCTCNTLPYLWAGKLNSRMTCVFVRYAYLSFFVSSFQTCAIADITCIQACIFVYLCVVSIQHLYFIFIPMPSFNISYFGQCILIYSPVFYNYNTSQ